MEYKDWRVSTNLVELLAAEAPLQVRVRAVMAVLEAQGLPALDARALPQFAAVLRHHRNCNPRKLPAALFGLKWGWRNAIPQVSRHWEAVTLLFNVLDDPEGVIKYVHSTYTPAQRTAAATRIRKVIPWRIIRDARARMAREQARAQVRRCPCTACRGLVLALCGY